MIDIYKIILLKRISDIFLSPVYFFTLQMTVLNYAHREDTSKKRRHSVEHSTQIIKFPLLAVRFREI